MNKADLPLENEARKQAILAWALGLTRGAIHSLISEDKDDVDLDYVRKILKETSASALARRFGYDEFQLAIDWNDHLSKQELLLIQNSTIEKD